MLAAATEEDGGRDAKLSSLLLLSPGKEYWAGRLAAQARRDSESPRPAPGRHKSRLNNNRNNALGEETDASSSPLGDAVTLSPVGGSTGSNSNDDAPSPGVRRRPQMEDIAAAPGDSPAAGRKKGYFSFTVGKRGTPLSPSGSTASSSVWSTQAFTSPRGAAGGGGGGATSSPRGGKGRVDLSPWRPAPQKGEAWSPSSPLSSASASLSPAKGGQWRRAISPGGAPRFGSAAAIAASLQAAKRDGGALYPAPSPAGGGGGRDFSTASSSRFSPGKESVGVGSEARSWSASPPRNKVRLPP